MSAGSGSRSEHHEQHGKADVDDLAIEIESGILGPHDLRVKLKKLWSKGRDFGEARRREAVNEHGDDE